MNVSEIKKEINNKLNSLGESQLKTVDKFIEKINASSSEWDLKKYVDEILIERADVLKIVAQ